MPKERMRRVNEAVREVLSTAISKDLKDPRIGFVTVTAVDTSPDLRHARVYVSVLGGEKERTDTLAGLASAHGYLQSCVASELRLKNTPQLDFHYDESVDRGARITEILREGETGGVTRAVDATERDEIVAELKLADKFLVTTHENPDGDALGSLLAMHEIMKVMGKDSVMFMSRENFPLPYEYRNLPLKELVHEIPADAGERTIVFLDCGNIDRMPVDFFQRDDAHILNIDHHHDNTNFGTANLVVGHASCTAEILYSLLDDLGVELNPKIAEALYVALVTDTGRFQYENTTAVSHRMAADLIEAGADVHGLFRQLYENVPLGKVLLMGRVLTRIQSFDGGLLAVSYISREDYEIAGSDESLSEGIVDHIRALDGTLVAALVREQLKSEREGIRKVSLRASDDSIDVSVIARKENGGGHRQAAGFSTEKSTDELIAFIRAEIAAQVDPVN